MAGRDGTEVRACGVILTGAEGDLRAELLTENFDFSDDEEAQAASKRGKMALA